MDILTIFTPFILIIGLVTCVGICIICSFISIIRRNNIRYELV